MANNNPKKKVWLFYRLCHFNPKEQKRFNDVIDSMIAEQLMITGFTKLQFYITEKGEKLMGEGIVWINPILIEKLLPNREELDSLVH